MPIPTITLRISNPNRNSNFAISNYSHVITAQNNNYQRTKQQLFEIDNIDCEDDEDDWGATRPTRYAWQCSLEILQEIEKLMQSNFPLGFASLDSDGGVELIWKNYKIKNEIRLSIPSCNGTDMSLCIRSLYIRDYGNGKSKLLTNPSINQVVRALQFLYQ